MQGACRLAAPALKARASVICRLPPCPVTPPLSPPRFLRWEHCTLRCAGVLISVALLATQAYLRKTTRPASRALRRDDVRLPLQRTTWLSAALSANKHSQRPRPGRSRGKFYISLYGTRFPFRCEY
jgi:hypothetical protein